MDGVDTHNQLCANLVVNRKAKKWVKKFTFYFLEQILVSSFIVYRETTGKLTSGRKLSLCEYFKVVYEEVVPFLADQCRRQMRNSGRGLLPADRIEACNHWSKGFQ